MKQHYKELDSLRGIASLIVLVTHFLFIFPIIDSHVSFKENPLFFILKYSPLRSFFSGGTEAVKLFFVLSGFVLSLPFVKGRNVPYSVFILKRICRIYIPYIIAISIAVLCSIILHGGYIKEFSNWYNSLSWVTPTTFNLLIGHLFLIGNFNVNAYDNVIWSLVEEMRISLIFPLLMIFVVRFNWKQTVVMSLIVSFIGFQLQSFGHTLSYIFMFSTGALIAKHRDYLMTKYDLISKKVKFFLFLLGFILFSIHVPATSKILPISSSLNAIGCTLLIIIALSPGIFSKVLMNKAIHYIGKISYSLYLYHCIVLMACIKLLYSHISVGYILLIAFFISILVASMSFHIIEFASIKLGKKLSDKMFLRKTLSQNTVNLSK